MTRCLYAFLLLMQVINCYSYQAEMELEIFKIADGKEVAVSDTQQEIAGTNLTLICKITNRRQWELYGDYLIWGWKRAITFNNVQDLKDLAQEHQDKLKQFTQIRLDYYKSPQAEMQFRPLYPHDSGSYFCGERDKNIFKIINLSVIVGNNDNDIQRYVEVLNQSVAEFINSNDEKPRIVLPRFLCTNDKFMCNSRDFCISYEYVCDGVDDCNDASDESMKLCGHSACTVLDKPTCITKGCCCEKDQNLKCLYWANNNCCGKRYVEKERYRQFIPLDVISSESVSFSPPGTSVGLIVVPCFVIAIIIGTCIIFRQRLLKIINRIRTTGSPDDPTIAQSDALTAQVVPPPIFPRLGEFPATTETGGGDDNRHTLPSYDEVVSNSLPSAPLFEKFAH